MNYKDPTKLERVLFDYNPEIWIKAVHDRKRNRPDPRAKRTATQPIANTPYYITPKGQS